MRLWESFVMYDVLVVGAGLFGATFAHQGAVSPDGVQSSRKAVVLPDPVLIKMTSAPVARPSVSRRAGEPFAQAILVDAQPKMPCLGAVNK